jgi:hypothetical protein
VCVTILCVFTIFNLIYFILILQMRELIAQCINTVPDARPDIEQITDVAHRMNKHFQVDYYFIYYLFLMLRRNVHPVVRRCRQWTQIRMRIERE